MQITWNEPHHAPVSAAIAEPSGGITPERPHKLKKKVSSAHPELTPATTPAPKKPKSGGLSLFKKSGRIVSEPAPSTFLAAGGPPSPAGSEDSAASWHHHESYFPEYEPLFPTSTTGAKEFVSPYTTMLTPEEIRRQHHAAVLGSAVAVHYPDLPSWAEYTAKAGGDKDKSKVGWQSGKWGTEGWTGYGWGGEALPTTDGTTFGLPMAKGVEIKPPGAGGKDQKKKKKGDAGGGGGDDAGGGEDGAGDD